MCINQFKSCLSQLVEFKSIYLSQLYINILWMVNSDNSVIVDFD